MTNKTFGIIENRIVTCVEAVKYRDTVLIRHYEGLLRDYDAGKEKRRQLALAELNAHLMNAELAWTKAGPVMRKQVYGQIAALAVSVAAKATGGWAAARSGLTGVEKEVAEELHDRSAFIVNKIATAAYTTPDVDPVDLAQQCAGLIIAVSGMPVASAALFGVGLLYGAIGAWGTYTEYVAAKSDYETDAATMRKAMQRIAENSVDGQIKRLLDMANEIASKCSN